MVYMVGIEQGINTWASSKRVLIAFPANRRFQAP
jgi:hypothetical protein